MHATQISLIPSFHYDVAYLKPAAEYLPDCFANIDEALRILDADSSYTYLLEQVILLEAYVQAKPEKLKDLKRFAKEGRLSVAPGMYVMPDMNMPSAETMYWQILLGKKWLRENLDFNPTVCWIADCWGHHAQLPQILTSCGYTSYIFWRCMRRDVKKNDFLWRGIDGSTIRTHWIARGYSNLRFPSQAEEVNILEINRTGCSAPQIKELCEDLESFGAGISVLLCNSGDMAFPQASAPESVRQLNQSGILPPIRFATPEDAIRDSGNNNLQTIDGEFNSALQGTFTSNIWIKQNDRRLTQKMIAIQTLAALKGKPLDLARLWKPLLKQQFHDIICGTICDKALDDCRNEFTLADTQMDQALREIGSCGNAAYFNALPFERTELLQSPGGLSRIDLPPLACGKAEKLTVDSTPKAAGGSFENPWYRACIGADGYLSSLIEKHSGRDIASANPIAFGGLSMQLDYGDLWLNFIGPLSGGSEESALTQNDPDPFDRSKGTIVAGTLKSTIQSAQIVRHSADIIVIEQRGSLWFWRIKLPFTTRITLSRWSPRIDYHTEIQTSSRNYRVRVCFPTTLAGGVRTDEISMGLQQRDAGEHVAQHFTRLAKDGAALALLNAGTPASNVHDGVLMLTLMRSAAMEYKTQSAQSYMENQTLALDYAIVPHAGDDLLTPIREGHAFNMPPLAVAEHDALPKIMVDAGNVLISSVTLLPEGLFVRLYESTGAATHATLHAQGARFITPANGMFASDENKRTAGESRKITLKPYEIQSYQITR